MLITSNTLRLLVAFAIALVDQTLCYSLVLKGNSLGFRYLQNRNCHVESELIINSSSVDRKLNIFHKFNKSINQLCISKSNNDDALELVHDNVDQVWNYSIQDNNSIHSNNNSETVISVNLDEVINRDRIIIQTSFILNEDPSNDDTAKDILIVIREHDNISSAAVSFLQTHVPNSFVNSTTAPVEDPMENPSFQTLYAYMINHLNNEVTLRLNIRNTARQLVHTYINHCPLGIKIGIGILLYLYVIVCIFIQYVYNIRGSNLPGVGWDKCTP